MYFLIVKCVYYACDFRRLHAIGRLASSLLIKLLLEKHVFLLSYFFFLDVHG